MSKTIKLVLVRHGESQWNKENRFTGWVDVDLSEKGREEARHAGQLLKQEGFQFDEAHTSILKRAIRTLWAIQDETDQMWLPVHRSWRLNERHYGALQGLNKSETAAKYGEEQVFIWRRSYDITPPPMTADQAKAQLAERRLQEIPRADLPACEALLQCKDRVMPYWEKALLPALKAERKLLIVAHGNSLRALIKHLDHVPDDEIAELNVPTGIPLVYELDAAQLKPIKHYYLGDPEAAKKAAQAVAQQGKK